MSDKNVLITGASRGIGKAAASAFAAEGWHIYALARNKDGALEKMKEEIIWISEKNIYQLVV